MLSTTSQLHPCVLEQTTGNSVLVWGHFFSRKRDIVLADPYVFPGTLRKKKNNASCGSPGLNGSSGWWRPVASSSEHRAGVGYAAAGAGAGLGG